MAPRYGPGDFGYTFVGYDPPENDGETTAIEVKQDEEKDEEEPKERFIFKPSKGQRGLMAGGDDEDKLMDMAGNGPLLAVILGGCCCCLTVIMFVVGGVLITWEEYSGDGIVLAASILLVVAAGTCLCACCSFCLGCTASGFSGKGSGSDGRGGGDPKEVKVKLRRLNDRFERTDEASSLLRDFRLDVVGDIKEIKEAEKKEQKLKKETEKKNKEELEKRVKADLEAGLSVEKIKQNYRPVVFYIDFNGDMMVSGMELLRKQVSLILRMARPKVDQVVVVVTSPGGFVAAYGLAASQLVRIRKAGIHLVTCIDSMAASGGYMMASVGDVIYAAPFAIVGSVGVVTQIPNFQRFLEKHDVDAYLFTAGKYKRTIDVIGEVTEEGKAKLQEELDDMHTAFKDHIALARPKLKDTVETIATGEHWLAVQAKEKGLVDEIMTSDEYLESLVAQEYDIVEIIEKKKKHSMFSDLIDLNAAARSVRSAIEEGMLTSAASHKQRHFPMAV